jgi:hypothetical protein
MQQITCLRFAAASIFAKFGAARIDAVWYAGISGYYLNYVTYDTTHVVIFVVDYVLS